MAKKRAKAKKKTVAKKKTTKKVPAKRAGAKKAAPKKKAKQSRSRKTAAPTTKTTSDKNLFYISVASIVAILVIVLLVLRGGTGATSDEIDTNIGGLAGLMGDGEGKSFHGGGTLEVHGSGSLLFDGRTIDTGIDIEDITDGVVYIYDYAHNARISAQGFGEREEKLSELPEPNIYTYTGNGTLSLQGSNLVFDARGDNATVFITGLGNFKLQGEGWFTFENFAGKKVGPIAISSEPGQFSE